MGCEPVHIGLTAAPGAEVADLGVLPEIRWYAVLTHPGREARAERELRNQGYAVFLPLRLVEIRLPGKQRRLATVTRPLYPRYVFAGIEQTGPGQLGVGPIAHTRGVSGVLGDRLGPLAIPAPVMDRQLRRADRQGIVEITEVPADHLFVEGQTARFREESLWRGYTGTICRVDSRGMIQILIDSSVSGWRVEVHYSELLPPDAG